WSGRPEEALEEAEIALKLTPTWCNTQYILGAALIELGRNEEAEKRFEEAVRLDPLNSEIYHCWGSALKSQGRLDEADEKLHKAASLDSNSIFAGPHLSMAKIFEKQGRLEEAALEYCQAIALRPHYDSPLAALLALLPKLRGNSTIE